MHSFDLTTLSDLASARRPGLAGVVDITNHPNPFKDATTIRLSLTRPAAVALAIYDLAGRKVRSLGGGSMTAGVHELRWDGRNDRDRRVASGVYFIRLESEEGSAAHRLNLVR